MAYSEVEIVNLALNNLGRASIRNFSVSETDPKTGRISERLYAIARDNLVSKHDWSFARKTSVLQQSTEEHVEGVLYQIPSECFVPRRIGPRTGRPNVWRVEGRMIMIPTAFTSTYGCTPYLRYTQYVKNTSVFPPYFVNALVDDITARLCMPLTKDKKRSTELYQLARGSFGQAAFIDSNLDAGDDHHMLDLENDSFVETQITGVVFDG